jgi:type IV pilus assembly protein PilX
MKAASRYGSPALRQRGVVLIATLLLLVVMTLMAMGMFRSVNVQEKIAGNVLQKQAAVNAAQGALQYAESWLAANATTSSAVTCSTLQAAGSATLNTCTNALAATVSNPVTTPPWTTGAGVPLGVTYTPTGSGASSRFYIQDLGKNYFGVSCSDVFLIDAYGYDSTTNTVAVVESTYVIQPIINLNCW